MILRARTERIIADEVDSGNQKTGDNIFYYTGTDNNNNVFTYLLFVYFIKQTNKQTF